MSRARATGDCLQGRRDGLLEALDDLELQRTDLNFIDWAVEFPDFAELLDPRGLVRPAPGACFYQGHVERQARQSVDAPGAKALAGSGAERSTRAGLARFEPCAWPCARSRTETPHRVRRSRTLLHDRIEGTAPVFARVVHHDIDEHGHEKGQDRGAITHLIPVDPAVPGRAAVGKLVAKDVEPVKHEAQDLDDIPRPQGSRESTLRGPEPMKKRAIIIS